MERRNRLLWVALATAMLAPSKARARTRTYASVDPDRPPQKQARRRAERQPQRIAPVASPCGRHVVEVAAGTVLVDGRRVHPASGGVYVLAGPVWRRDGGAVAWIERDRGVTRLVVVPAVEGEVQVLPWTMQHLPGDRVFWAARNRVVVGPDLLAPRAVASWTP